MSLHNKPLTDLERNGLIKHGLPIDKPSQLSDAFRLGMVWALNEKDKDAGLVTTKLTKRQLAVEEMRNNGLSLNEIAEKLNITKGGVASLVVTIKKNRAKQEFEKQRHTIKTENEWLDLPTRAVNAIRIAFAVAYGNNHGYEPTPKNTRELINSGNLSIKSDFVGALTMDQILEWLKKYNA